MENTHRIVLWHTIIKLVVETGGFAMKSSWHSLKPDYLYRVFKHDYYFSNYDMEGKSSLGRPRCRQDDIKIDFAEIEFEDVDFTHMALDRDLWQALVNMVKNIEFHKSGNFLIN